MPREGHLRHPPPWLRPHGQTIGLARHRMCGQIPAVQPTAVSISRNTASAGDSRSTQPVAVSSEDLSESSSDTTTSAQYDMSSPNNSQAQHSSAPTQTKDSIRHPHLHAGVSGRNQRNIDAQIWGAGEGETAQPTAPTNSRTDASVSITPDALLGMQTLSMEEEAVRGSRARSWSLAESMLKALPPPFSMTPRVMPVRSWDYRESCTSATI